MARKAAPKPTYEISPTGDYPINGYKDPLTEQQIKDEFYVSITKELSKYNLTLEFNKQVEGVNVDVFIPQKNVAVFYHCDFYCSEAYLDEPTAKKIKYQNTLKLKSKGIKVFHIFQMIWKERPFQMMSFLKSILGLNEVKIHARKCEITNENSNTFIEEFHIQGKGSGVKQFFNLKYKGHIVGTITASRHHNDLSSKQESIVLSRLCFRDNCNVQGGSSKLVSAFVKWAKENNYKKIITWSDNIYSDGNVYKVLGFELENESNFDYFYFDTINNRYTIKQTLRQVLKHRPEGTSRRLFHMHLGSFRIYDIGKKRFVLDLAT